jgi:hypothetical protein
MTQKDLLEERQRALNLLNAFESGHMMSLNDDATGDLTNSHTEARIVDLLEQIAELDRRIAGHPDHSL